MFTVRPMNTPPSLARALLIFLIGAVPPASLLARVGEPQEAVERRILQPGVGHFYIPAKAKDPRVAERERAKEARELPFAEAIHFFPSESKVMLYWKSAVANQLSNDNGWKVIVYYASGRSMLESYNRVGEDLSEFEVRAILAANRGNSSWKKISNEGSDTTGIGYDYELEDGSLRAKQKGNWLVIFAARLDEYVIAQQKIAKDQEEKDAALQKIEQQKKAPESVIGF